MRERRNERIMELFSSRREIGQPSIHDVWLAKNRISSIVEKTPLIKSARLSEQFSASIYLKLENLHEMGAFKIRGAANKILSLLPEEKKLGVATFSTGNHGLAVAYIARKLGIPAHICISNRVPQAKVNALENMGAIINIFGKSQDEAEDFCYRLAEEKGLTVIKPFDDPLVIAGQGTIGLELLEDCPEMDTVIVPVSGGGLISGVALALKSNVPEIKVIGVSMENSAVMYQSIKAGKPVSLEEENTLADSLLGGLGRENFFTFSMVQKYVDEMVLVSEKAIAQGLAFIMKWHRMMVEGAAAVGIASLLDQQVVSPGSHVAIIVSGNNVDLNVLLRATKDYMETV